MATKHNKRIAKYTERQTKSYQKLYCVSSIHLRSNNNGYSKFNKIVFNKRLMKIHKTNKHMV